MKQTRIVQTRNMTPYSRKNNNQTTANHARQNTNLDKIALLTILAEFAFCLAGHLHTAIFSGYNLRFLSKDHNGSTMLTEAKR